MLRTLHAIWDDTEGFVVSAELVLVLTIAVLSMVVGLHAVSKSVTYELGDLSSAFGALNQSYAFKGLKKKGHAYVVGSAYHDSGDECDCSEIVETKPNPKRDAGHGPEGGGRRRGW